MLDQYCLESVGTGIRLEHKSAREIRTSENRSTGQNLLELLERLLLLFAPIPLGLLPGQFGDRRRNRRKVRYEAAVPGSHPQELA